MNKPPRAFSRRRFFASLGAVSLGGGVYTRFVEPHWLAIRREQVQLEADASGTPITLVQLSDLHASEVVSLEFIRAAVASAIAQKPDLICLTGDFVTGRYAELDGLAQALAPLSAVAPTVASLGNHDGGAWSRACHAGFNGTTEVLGMLSQAGIAPLNNACETLSLRGRPFRIVGLQDVWAGGFHPAKCLTAKGDATPTIVMSHNPDTKDSLRDRSWNLLLAGHTHGGQLRLPLVGAPFAPVRDRRFLSGLHRWEERWLHVSAGVGNLHSGRFNCRPEINVLTLI